MSTPQADINVSFVLTRLEALPPAGLQAPLLLARLFELERSRTLTPDICVELQPEIERSIAKLEKHAKSAKEVVSRCCALAAAPGNQVPPGF